MYCEKSYHKISRHLKVAHPNEKLVQQYLSAKPMSKHSQETLKYIRNLGNHLHNQKVLKQGDGEIITGRRLRDIKVIVLIVTYFIWHSLCAN